MAKHRTRIKRDPNNADRWQPQKWNIPDGPWSDIGDGKDDYEEAKAALDSWIQRNS